MEAACWIRGKGVRSRTMELHRAMNMRSGIHVWLKRQVGNRWEGRLGEDTAPDFWRVPGPKAVFVHALGYSAAMWCGNVDQVIHDGRPASSTCFLACEEITGNYSAVAFFEYPGYYPVNSARVAGALKQAMQGAATGDRIDMIALSLGGIVARYYVEKMDGRRFVDNLVTIQSPNAGVSLDKASAAVKSVANALPNGLEGFAPLAALLKDSDFMRDLNRPWVLGEGPVSRTGFGGTRYFCIASGLPGTGTSPDRAAGWHDGLSRDTGSDISAASALFLPLGDGRLHELDSTGRHEYLYLPSDPAHARFARHGALASLGGHDDRARVAAWLRDRLWGDGKPPARE